MGWAMYERLNVHVYATNYELIRAVRRVIHKKALHKRLFRDGRHGLYREMIKHHKDARELVDEFRLIAS